MVTPDLPETTGRQPERHAAQSQGVYVLGMLMAGTDTVQDLTGEVRTVWEGLREKTNGAEPSLALVYGDPALSRLEIRLDVAQKGSARISLVTLGLFLHWKLAFHDQRSTVDVPSVLNDVKSLAGLVKPEQVANALWMMGAYLGMEHFAPTYRHLNRQKYRALLFAGQEERLELVPAWQLKDAAAPPAHEAAAVPVHSAGAAELGPNGPAQANSTASSHTHQAGGQERKDLLEAGQTEDTQEQVPDSTGPSPAPSFSGEGPAAGNTVVIP